jgi:hypothetical protein
MSSTSSAPVSHVADTVVPVPVLVAVAVAVPVELSVPVPVPVFCWLLELAELPELHATTEEPDPARNAT